MAEQSPLEALHEAAPTPIAQISPDIAHEKSRVLDGVVTITWPYSSVTKSIAFILAEHDFLLRRRQGQLRVEFFGTSGKAISDAKIGGGDKVRLSLDGSQLAHRDTTTALPAGSLEWQLKYTHRLHAIICRDGCPETETLIIDGPESAPDEATELDSIPQMSSPVRSVHEAQHEPNTIATPHTQKSGVRSKRIASSAFEEEEFASPAFIKRARVSYGSLFEGDFDSLINMPERKREQKRRKSRFSMGNATWTYSSRSPSPDADCETKPEDSNSPEPVPIMVDEGCQTEHDYASPHVSISAHIHAAEGWNPQYSSPTPIYAEGRGPSYGTPSRTLFGLANSPGRTSGSFAQPIGLSRTAAETNNLFGLGRVDLSAPQAGGAHGDCLRTSGVMENKRSAAPVPEDGEALSRSPEEGPETSGVPKYMSSAAPTVEIGGTSNHGDDSRMSTDMDYMNSATPAPEADGALSGSPREGPGTSGVTEHTSSTAPAITATGALTGSFTEGPEISGDMGYTSSAAPAYETGETLAESYGDGPRTLMEYTRSATIANEAGGALVGSHGEAPETCGDIRHTSSTAPASEAGEALTESHEDDRRAPGAMDYVSSVAIPEAGGAPTRSHGKALHTSGVMKSVNFATTAPQANGASSSSHREGSKTAGLTRFMSSAVSAPAPRMGGLTRFMSSAPPTPGPGPGGLMRFMSPAASAPAFNVAGNSNVDVERHLNPEPEENIDPDLRSHEDVHEASGVLYSSSRGEQPWPAGRASIYLPIPAHHPTQESIVAVGSSSPSKEQDDGTKHHTQSSFMNDEESTGQVSPSNNDIAPVADLEAERTQEQHSSDSSSSDDDGGDLNGEDYDLRNYADTLADDDDDDDDDEDDEDEDEEESDSDSEDSEIGDQSIGFEEQVNRYGQLTRKTADENGGEAHSGEEPHRHMPTRPETMDHQGYAGPGYREAVHAETEYNDEEDRILSQEAVDWNDDDEEEDSDDDDDDDDDEGGDEEGDEEEEEEEAPSAQATRTSSPRETVFISLLTDSEDEDEGDEQVENFAATWPQRQEEAVASYQPVQTFPFTHHGATWQLAADQQMGDEDRDVKEEPGSAADSLQQAQEASQWQPPQSLLSIPNGVSQQEAVEKATEAGPVADVEGAEEKSFGEGNVNREDESGVVLATGCEADQAVEAKTPQGTAAIAVQTVEETVTVEGQRGSSHMSEEVAYEAMDIEAPEKLTAEDGQQHISSQQAEVEEDSEDIIMESQPDASETIIVRNAQEEGEEKTQVSALTFSQLSQDDTMGCDPEDSTATALGPTATASQNVDELTRGEAHGTEGDVMSVDEEAARTADEAATAAITSEDEVMEDDVPGEAEADDDDASTLPDAPDSSDVSHAGALDQSAIVASDDEMDTYQTPQTQPDVDMTDPMPADSMPTDQSEQEVEQQTEESASEYEYKSETESESDSDANPSRPFDDPAEAAAAEDQILAEMRAYATPDAGGQADEEAQMEVSSSQGEEPVPEDSSSQGEEPVLEDSSYQDEEPVSEDSSSQGEEPVPEVSSSQGGKPVREDSASQDEQPVPEVSSFQGEQPVREDSASQGEEPVPEDSSSQGEDPVLEDSSYQDEEPVSEDSSSQGGKPVREDSASQDEQPVPEISSFQGEQPVREDSASQGEEPVLEDSSYQDEEPVSEDSSFQGEEPVPEVSSSQGGKPVREDSASQDEQPVPEISSFQGEQPVPGDSASQGERPVQKEVDVHITVTSRYRSFPHQKTGPYEPTRSRIVDPSIALAQAESQRADDGPVSSGDAEGETGGEMRGSATAPRGEVSGIEAEMGRPGSVGHARLDQGDTERRTRAETGRPASLRVKVGEKGRKPGLTTSEKGHDKGSSRKEQVQQSQGKHTPECVVHVTRSSKAERPDPSLLLASASAKPLPKPEDERSSTSIRVTRSMTEERTSPPTEIRKSQGGRQRQVLTPARAADRLVVNNESNESPSTIKRQLGADLRTKLPDFIPLRSLRASLHKIADIFAVATSTTPPPSRPKHGPRDYMLELTLTDPSIAPTGITIGHIFRPHQASLPLVHAGDVLLLRRVQVVSMKGRGWGVRATDASAWAVFEKDDPEMLPQIRGPPVEVAADEVAFAAGLRKWWDSLDGVAGEKLEKATQRILQARV
ncbi:hypothetical protein E4U30_003261 [Claviceps sp. LM220 group G6]|nr:hypothetical protein E4U30_003261 [Claviceps sp. LM220 group G6]